MSNKNALVTGASRGLGAATALALAASGWDVTVLARTEPGLQQVAERVRRAGGTARVLVADLTDAAAVRAAVARAAEAAGPFRLLVNNAGMVHPIARLVDLSAEDFERTVAVNLHGAMYAIQAVLPGMLELGNATIVQVSSGAAHRPFEGWTSYCVGKAGLWMLTRSIALELPPQKVAVFGFQPGTVDTRMQAHIRASGINPVSEMARSDHLPAEVPARCVAWYAERRPLDWHGTDQRVHTVLERMSTEPSGTV